MEKLSNTEVEFKKSVAYNKKLVLFELHVTDGFHPSKTLGASHLGRIHQNAKNLQSDLYQFKKQKQETNKQLQQQQQNKKN